MITNNTAGHQCVLFFVLLFYVSYKNLCTSAGGFHSRGGEVAIKMEFLVFSSLLLKLGLGALALRPKAPLRCYNPKTPC